MKMTLEQKVIERYLAEERLSPAEIIAEFNIPEFQFWDIVLTWARACLRNSSRKYGV